MCKYYNKEESSEYPPQLSSSLPLSGQLSCHLIPSYSPKTLSTPSTNTNTIQLPYINNLYFPGSFVFSNHFEVTIKALLPAYGEGVARIKRCWVWYRGFSWLGGRERIGRELERICRCRYYCFCYRCHSLHYR
jgi:hypothetical protein